MTNYDDPIGIILEHEGGYVNNASDRGGPTNFGITQKTLSEHRGYAVSVDEVKNMTEDEAREIYSNRYLTGPKIDKLPWPHPGICVFDIGVNSGPRRAIKMLQEVLNKAGFPCGAADGVIGPKTIGACEEAQKEMGNYLQNALVEDRIKFYLAIVSGNPSQQIFLKGWLRRANSFKLPV